MLTDPLPYKFQPQELQEVWGMSGESQGRYILIPESTTSSGASRGIEGPLTPQTPFWGVGLYEIIIRSRSLNVVLFHKYGILGSFLILGCGKESKVLLLFLRDGGQVLGFFIGVFGSAHRSHPSSWISSRKKSRSWRVTAGLVIICRKKLTQDPRGWYPTIMEPLRIIFSLMAGAT